MSTGAEIQNQIDVLIKSESVSVNTFQLMNSCSKVQSISQSKEELEKYYIKNFKDIKGFFQVSYLTNNNQKLVSTILDEQGFQELSKNTDHKIIEASIMAICSVEKNMTVDDIKLTISNVEFVTMYNIEINEADKNKEISSNKTQSLQTSQVEAQEKLKQNQQKQTTHSLKRKIVDSDDEMQVEHKQFKQDGQQLAKEKEQLKNLTITPNQKKMDVEEDKNQNDQEEDDDDEFIAQHIKRNEVAQQGSKDSGKKEDSSKASNQNSGKANSKQQSKTQAPAQANKITNFFKKK